MSRLLPLAFLLLVATILCTAVDGVSSPLPDVFLSVLTDLKAKTNVPVMLPTELPSAFSDAKYANVLKATAEEYSVSLYYESGVGDAGFAASFGGKKNASSNPPELPNVRAVKLADGVVGFFRPVSCGGSCAPANLWSKQGTVLYWIQLRLSSTLHEKNQERIITAVANSAILAGPR